MKNVIDKEYLQILDRELVFICTYIIIVEDLNNKIEKIDNRFLVDLLGNYSNNICLCLGRLFDKSTSSNSLYYVVKQFTDKEKAKEFIKKINELKKEVAKEINRRNERIAHSNRNEDNSTFMYAWFNKRGVNNLKKIIEELKELILNLKDEFGWSEDCYYVFDSIIEDYKKIIK